MSSGEGQNCPSQLHQQLLHKRQKLFASFEHRASISSHSSYGKVTADEFGRGVRKATFWWGFFFLFLSVLFLWPFFLIKASKLNCKLCWKTIF